MFIHKKETKLFSMFLPLHVFANNGINTLPTTNNTTNKLLVKNTKSAGRAVGEEHPTATEYFMIKIVT
jgi:hypothetical protein